MRLKYTVCVLAIMALLPTSAVLAQSNEMSFFITSRGPGDGANVDGLAGADLHCTALAAVATNANRPWRAYLSTTAQDDQPAVNARDRIGTGPWKNANGVIVAQNVDDLHSENNKLNKENSLTEKGAMVNGRGDTPNQHDILTGSTIDGRASTNSEDTTCGNWTSNDEDGSAFVGHHDRQGGGSAPTSWNSSHPSSGCSQENLQATGGNGLFYCFLPN